MRGSFEPIAQPGKRRGVRAVRVAVAKRRVAPGKMTRPIGGEKRRFLDILELSCRTQHSLYVLHFFLLNIPEGAETQRLALHDDDDSNGTGGIPLIEIWRQ